MRPHIIGIAGPSSSGKTEIAGQICRELPGACIVSIDAYHRHRPDLTSEQRARVNYDEPDVIEWELLHHHLQATTEGRSFDQPVYSFLERLRTSTTVRVEPVSHLIVEGIFGLYWPEVRALMQTKVFVETDLDICYQRRLARDIVERGWTPGLVRRQYEENVRPSALRYIRPTARYADLVVSGEQPVAESVRMILDLLPRAMAAAS